MSNKSPKDKVMDFIKEQLDAVERCEAAEIEAEARISYAKTKLMKLEPFFAMLLFKMPTFPSYQVQTAATDGTIFLYNPIWISETVLRKDLVFILLHEIEHIFFKHNIRGPIRFVNAEKLFKEQTKNKERGIKDIFLDHEVGEMRHTLKEWNYATDYVINEHNKNNVKIPLSKEMEKNLLFNKKYADMTSEACYDLIKTPYDPNQDDGDEGMDLGIGGVLPQGFGGLSDEEVKILQKEFDQEVQAAAFVAKRAGNLPKGIEEVIESLYKTTTPWQDVFRTVFTSIQKQDYTFMYPNKRYTAHMMDYGVIMPSLWGEEFVDAGFIFDTSGSVGKKEKEILTSELKNILEDYNIRLHVLYCDTKAYTDNVQVLTRDDIKNGKLKLNPKGGGGTAMKPAFDYFREKQDEFDFQVVICMTDMELFDWGKLGSEPPFSVYWAALPGYNKKQQVDFGTIVEIAITNKNQLTR